MILLFQVNLITSSVFLSPDTADPANTVLPGPGAPEPPTTKRTRAAVQKVPYFRLSSYMMNNTSQPQAQPQEQEAAKEIETNKRRKTRTTASGESLNTGIPSCSLSRWTKSIHKTATTSHPLAGQIRVSESQSLSVSSGDCVHLPDDFHINIGYAPFLSKLFWPFLLLFITN